MVHYILQKPCFLKSGLYFDTLKNYDEKFIDELYFYTLLLYYKNKNSINISNDFYLLNIKKKFFSKIYIMLHALPQYYDLSNNVVEKEQNLLLQKEGFVGFFSIWIFKEDQIELEKLGLNIIQCYIIENNEDIIKLEKGIRFDLATYHKSVEYEYISEKYFAIIHLESKYIKNEYKMIKIKNDDWYLIPAAKFLNNMFNKKLLTQNEIKNLINDWWSYYLTKQLNEAEETEWLNTMTEYLLCNKYQDIYFLFRITKINEKSLFDYDYYAINFSIGFCDYKKDKAVINDLSKLNFELNSCFYFSLNDSDNIAIKAIVDDSTTKIKCVISYYSQKFYDPFFFIKFKKIKNK